ncbi:MAG: hypothetical protein N2381_11275, partial [Armatimonadetes bacterium]|nr:hypothetical protein [Armatimonadota bacterium]
MAHIFRDTKPEPNNAWKQGLEKFVVRHETKWSAVKNATPLSLRGSLQTMPTWELHVARNEWEAVQLAVRCERNFLWMRVKVEPEVERLFDVQIRYVGYIHLPANSRATPAEELVRKAPADFPDPLLDLPFVPLKANETQPVFVKLRPKRTTKAGVYNVPLIVQTPVGEQKANLRVRVYP